MQRDAHRRVLAGAEIEFLMRVRVHRAATCELQNIIVKPIADSFAPTTGSRRFGEKHDDDDEREKRERADVVDSDFVHKDSATLAADGHGLAAWLRVSYRLSRCSGRPFRPP